MEINDWKLKCVLETPEEQPAAAAPAAPITSSGKFGFRNFALNYLCQQHFTLAVSAPLASVPPAPIIKEDKAVKDGSSQRVRSTDLTFQICFDIDYFF